MSRSPVGRFAALFFCIVVACTFAFAVASYCPNPSPKSVAVPVEQQLSGSQCRLMNLTSLDFGEYNTITVEFSTPRMADPNGIVLCSLHPDYTFSPDSFSFRYLFSSGDQFTSPQVAPLNNANWPLNPMEYGSLQDIISNDEFYASSFIYSRYDDFDYDSSNIPLSGLFRNIGSKPNCVVLSASFLRSARYELQIQIKNPPKSTSDKNTLQFWFAPLTYTLEDDYLLMHVRGGKYGSICQPREGLNVLLGSTVCYPAPGVACSENERLSSGGECVSCSSVNAECCPSGSFLPNPVGLVGCVESKAHDYQSFLCDLYSKKLDNYTNGFIGEAETYYATIPEFKQDALPLVDEYMFTKGMYDYITNIDYNMDGRRPYSPTRMHGVLPKCNEQSCEDGYFVSARDQNKVKLRDTQFNIRVNFRLIGQLLYMSTGKECKRLFDPSNSKEPIGSEIPRQAWP